MSKTCSFSKDKYRLLGISASLKCQTHSTKQALRWSHRSPKAMKMHFLMTIKINLINLCERLRCLSFSMGRTKNKLCKIK